MYKLSDIMWIEAGFGRSRRVMPFVLKENIICSLADDKLFQLDEAKSIYDNLYEICQNEYKFPTVVIATESRTVMPHLDTTNKSEPKILNIKLPKLFMIKHKKEYMSKCDITVNDHEIKKLANYFTKEKANQINNFSVNAMEK